MTTYLVETSIMFATLNNYVSFFFGLLLIKMRSVALRIFFKKDKEFENLVLAPEQKRKIRSQLFIDFSSSGSKLRVNAAA